jgi:predicted TIM-barrel fold metal-dependent hydrolase
MWAPIVPSCEIIDDLRLGFPTEQLQYLEVFTKASVSEEQFGEYRQALPRTDDQILAALDVAGITRVAITGFDERSACGVTFVHNESVAMLAERHPDRFITFAGRHYAGRLGAGRAGALGARAWLSGAEPAAFMIGRPATDRAYSPSAPKASS